MVSIKTTKLVQRMLLCGLGSLAIGLSVHSATAPSAGSIISNMAVGEYKEEGSNALQTSRSNLVQTTIIPVYSFTLIADRTIQAKAGQTVYFSHELTNTGNITDNYSLSVANLGGDSFDYSSLQVYLDVNRDGVPDDTLATTYTLASGESVALVIKADVPAGATLNQTGRIELKAVSATNSNQVVNTDISTVTDKSAILVRKSFSVSDVSQNDVVSVRLDYQNNGASASGQVDLSDVFDPAQLSYQAGGENWNGVAVDPASGSNDPAGINYYLDGNTLRMFLTSVPANSTGYIQFNVRVNRAVAGQIPNTVAVSYDDDNNNGTPNILTNSNTAVLNLKPVYAVEINGIAASASSAAPDNLVIAPAVAAGGEASFTNYVWNTGNTEDRFNLTFTNDGLPAPHQIEFYRADGITPLLDSNGDGIPDTGLLQPGEKLQIVVKARMPTTYADTSTTNYSVFPQAQSVGDSTKLDTVEDRTSLIVTDNNRLVDLTNRPEISTNGLGNGNVDNGGNAWKTLSANSGSSVIFPLHVKHTGTATSYVLSADDDGNFASLNLPAGVSSIRFYATATADCSALGAEIGSTRLLNDGDEQLYCAVVQLSPQAASATALPVYFRVSAATYVSSNNAANPGFDTIKDAITINSLNSVGVVALEPDLRGQIAPNGTIVYSHTLTNNTLAALGAAYHFSISNDRSNFNTTLYYDANDNGLFDSTDPLMTDLSILPGGQLAAGGQIRLFAKVQNTSYSGVGVVNTTVISLLDGANVAVDAVTDITTISDTQIRLTKLQAKDDACDGTPDGAFTTATLTIGRNPDGSGQCVLYRLVVQNQGALDIASFTFRDTTPEAMVMFSAPVCADCTAGTISSPVTGQGGSVRGTVPDVASGASHEFEFGVRYVGQ